MIHPELKESATVGIGGESAASADGTCASACAYPARYESRVVTKGGIEVLIRPIKPEDAGLLVELFKILSPTSIYYRFFSPMKSLSPELLDRLTRIDHDRAIALVAIQKTEEGEKMLGVARIMGEPHALRAEFAVLVGDPWQGKGVGAALLERCLAIAKERGFEYVWGIVLPENTTMISLGRKLGFSLRRAPDSGDYELSIDLKRLEPAVSSEQ